RGRLVVTDAAAAERVRAVDVAAGDPTMMGREAVALDDRLHLAVRRVEAAPGLGCQRIAQLAEAGRRTEAEEVAGRGRRSERALVRILRHREDREPGAPASGEVALVDPEPRRRRHAAVLGEDAGDRREIDL